MKYFYLVAFVAAPPDRNISCSRTSAVGIPTNLYAKRLQKFIENRNNDFEA